MADPGIIRQKQGPFNIEEIIIPPNDLTGHFRIGISIGEKDFMSWRSRQNQGNEQPDPNNDFYFNIKYDNNSIWQTIYIGRTYKYQTEKATPNTQIKFPQGAPASVLVEFVSGSIE